jgi:hypothetical protein
MPCSRLVEIALEVLPDLYVFWQALALFNLDLVINFGAREFLAPIRALVAYPLKMLV